VREFESSDTILVQVNPVKRPETPRTACAILDRVNEVALNAALLKELRMIALLRQVADPGYCEGAPWAGTRVRRISGGIAAAGASSKLNAGRDFLRLLRDEGRAAEAFLVAHAGSLGPRSMLDLNTLLAGV
jgi:NTE family protein